MKTFFVRALSVLVFATSMTAVTGAYAQTTYAQYIQLWKTNWAAYEAEEAIPLSQRGVVVQSVDLRIVINRPIDKVYAIYANVYTATGLHPYLSGIIPINHHQHGNVETFDFVALENIPMPDGTIYNGQTISRQRFHSDEFYYDADTYDAPGVITHQHIVFTAIGQGQTQVIEHLTFEAPAQYIDEEVQGGAYAHQLVQQGLKAEIEAGELDATSFDPWLEGK
ncbi:hypothetical protein [Dyella sp. GSA-30]|uniref:hypothetical protein n=1 Tax=Dyella sp. GSA-30 TaxID=2994496 RepID=UPI00249398E0|nr:hypothetical protein [Dyella sp. GSA-30]BDU21667.1 hypothetical protein DYGSA30_31240 [Dyella sp. GSA-30]